ncbi:uncharacterized protein N7503_010616 [Penicillium pulvis]|uniref:uncharacterized protein n=1 Tax=Penicillium pulvis TaxID=1562058 RepID=UPI002547F97F|nr:uncharacterized protein N7503_010616 [Penicillium pulvis]KAJ5785404.1 hypothetical protein N7503_010616 [Penicillium pulvis]
MPQQKFSKPPDKGQDDQGSLITPPTTDGRQRGAVGDVQTSFDDLTESPAIRRSGQLPGLQEYQMSSDDESNVSNELWPSQPRPDVFSGRLQADQTLLDLTDHDVEIDAQLQSNTAHLPEINVPPQDEDIHANPQPNPPRRPWTRLTHEIDSMLRGSNTVQNQQPLQAPAQVASQPTKPQPSRDEARLSGTLAAQHAFEARLSRTARVELNFQAEVLRNRPAPETNSDRATLYEPGPRGFQLGEDSQIPLVKAGTAVLRPGPWAALILKSEIAVAIVGSELIRVLRRLPAQQEISIRWGKHVVLTGNILFQRTSSQLANVEAATIQVVGEVQYGLYQCHSCQRDEGLFAHCVKVEGNEACGNCHFGRNGHQCSFSAIVAPNRRRKRITLPFVELHDLVKQLQALLIRVKALKTEVRVVQSKGVEATRKNPEAELGPDHPCLTQRMQDYFRFLRHAFLGDLHTRLSTTDDNIEDIQDVIQKLIEDMENLMS